MSQGVWVLVAALAVATAFGLFRAVRDGRFRGTRAVRGMHPVRGAGAGAGDAQDAAGPGTHEPSVLAETGIAAPLGERATMLQFSSAFCAPCRATRRVLADVAALVPGVTHIEVDAELHLDLVRRLGVLRTPTTLILDQHGHEVTRAAGAPRKEAVLASLDRVLDTAS